MKEIHATDRASSGEGTPSSAAQDTTATERSGMASTTAIATAATPPTAPTPPLPPPPSPPLAVGEEQQHHHHQQQQQRKPPPTLGSPILQEAKHHVAYPKMLKVRCGPVKTAVEENTPLEDSCLLDDSQRSVCSKNKKGLKKNKHIIPVTSRPGAVAVPGGEEAQSSSANKLKGTMGKSQGSVDSQHDLERLISVRQQLDSRKERYMAYASDEFNDDNEEERNVDVEANNNTNRTSGPLCGSERPGAYTGLPGSEYERLSSLRVAVDSMRPGEDHEYHQDEPMVPLSTVESGDFHPLEQPATTGNRVSEPKIAAVRVDEDELEINIREEIANNAAQAEVVDFHEETREIHNKIQRKYVGLIVVIMAVVVAVLATVFTRGSNSSATTTVIPLPDDDDIEKPVKPTTLASIAKKAHLNCGISERDENTIFDPEYEKMLKGFQGDMCKAVAAASLNGDANATIHVTTEDDRWEALQNGTLDVLIVGTPSSTGGLYFDVDPEVLVSFSTPMFFDGVGVGGLPQYVENCAKEEGFQSVQACNSVRVCAIMGSTAMDVFEGILHPNQLVQVASLQQLYNQFVLGCCNMIATDWADERAELTVRNQGGYQGPYALGDTLYSRQPYAMATLQAQEYQRTNSANATTNHHDSIPVEEDPQVWTEFVDWVLQAVVAAEQHNITQSVAELFPTTDVFGEKYQLGFRHAVAAVGNYGEIYERNMGHVVPRAGMNLLNDGTTGLHYHQSIGDVSDFGTEEADGTLATIRDRGKLVCGIPQREAEEVIAFSVEGFLETGRSDNDTLGISNIDIDLCKALASSVFQGLGVPSAASDSCMAPASANITDTTLSDGRIEFVFLSSTHNGYHKLNDGHLDVIAGFKKTLEADVREPTTGKGYSFSQPYFFGPVPEGKHPTSNNHCLVTRQDDTQWSDFVQLVVMSLFYAEERGIKQQQANNMPIVNRFGPTYRRMLRDSVFGIGNYGETHDRLGTPRTGPNHLNLGGSPQLCAMPGII